VTKSRLQKAHRVTGSHTTRAPSTGLYEGHSGMPSPNPQSTCGLVGQTPMHPPAPRRGYRAGPVFHDLDENRTVPPEFEVLLSADFSSPVMGESTSEPSASAS